MLNKVVLGDAFARFSDTWRPKVAGDFNTMQVKLVKLAGELTWHHHETEDEPFPLVSEKLRIDIEEGAVELSPDGFVIIPHGVEDCTVAPPTAKVLLFEPSSTAKTGKSSDDSRMAATLDRLVQ